MGKGVVSKKLINFLFEKYKHVPWYISSKSWKPQWLTENYDLPIRLLIIPPVAATTALNKGVVNSWITKNKQATKAALETLKKDFRDTFFQHHLDYHKDFREYKDYITIVLTNNMNILAIKWAKDEDKEIGIIQHEFQSRLPVETNMASVFFASIITDMIVGNFSDYNKESLKSLIEKVLNYTYNWQKYEVERFLPKYWDPKKSSIIKVNKGISVKCDIEINEKYCYYVKQAIKIWKQALSSDNLGIIYDDSIGENKIELWRTMIEVDGYVCCVKSKQWNIIRLVQAVNSFAKSHKLQRERLSQACCLLHAPPGSGKTSLVRKLAENQNLRFIPFNISQLIERRGLLDCFDTIVTFYLQNPSEPLLVFIDEINSMIGSGGDAYSFFLAPLEDSVYIRGTRVFKLPPCFWIFATTQNEKEIRRDGKGSDFYDRMTHKLFDLSIPTGEDEMKRLENVYVGVAMILSSFLDVNLISKKVLDVFYNIKENTRLRALRHFIDAFKNIQYGKVKISNVPSDWFDYDVDQDIVDRIRKYQKVGDTEFIRIYP